MDRFRIQVSTKNQPSPTKPISETPISETKSIKKNVTNRDRLFGGYRSSKDIPAMSGPARRRRIFFFCTGTTFHQIVQKVQDNVLTSALILYPESQDAHCCSVLPAAQVVTLEQLASVHAHVVGPSAVQQDINTTGMS